MRDRSRRYDLFLYPNAVDHLLLLLSKPVAGPMATNTAVADAVFLLTCGRNLDFLKNYFDPRHLGTSDRTEGTNTLVSRSPLHGAFGAFQASM